MDVAALIIACVAVIVLVFVTELRMGTHRISGVALGQALFVVAWICQLVAITGEHVRA